MTTLETLRPFLIAVALLTAVAGTGCDTRYTHALDVDSQVDTPTTHARDLQD